MRQPNVDGPALKRAIEEFGSLRKAVSSLRTQKEQLEVEVAALKKGIPELRKARAESANKLCDVRTTIKKETDRLESIRDAVNRRGSQYALFESMVTMLLTSPSTQESLEDLAGYILLLAKKGWITSQHSGTLRQFLLTIVIGDHLHCYRCGSCGARFIMNNKPSSPHSWLPCLRYVLPCRAGFWLP